MMLITRLVDPRTPHSAQNNLCARVWQLGRAADSYVQPLADGSADSDAVASGTQLLTGQSGRIERVLYRKDFGTPGGWREIRGVQAVELNQRFAEIPTATERTAVAKRLHSFYLDRLGKLERYRRQVYSITLTRHTTQLWLGMLTVLEWPKDASEYRASANESATLPRFTRDTTEVCAAWCRRDGGLTCAAASTISHSRGGLGILCTDTLRGTVVCGAIHLWSLQSALSSPQHSRYASIGRCARRCTSSLRATGTASTSLGYTPTARSS